MKVILSIKPKFVSEIIKGNKLFEYRKVIFKSEVNKVIVYSSSPVKKIIGEFEIEKIIKDTPENVWEQTKEYSGISEQYFFDYFKNKKYAFAIKIKNFKLYEKSIELKELSPKLTPPQSFCYIP